MAEEVGIEALELLTAEGVAGLLKVSERTARRLFASGEIETITVGRSVRCTAAAYAAYIKKLEAARDGAAGAEQDVA